MLPLMDKNKAISIGDSSSLELSFGIYKLMKLLFFLMCGTVL